MQSFLIISKNPDSIQTFIEDFQKQHKISSFDVTTVESQTAIGIEAIRQIQKSFYLTPLRGTTKALIIKNAHLLTIEAQNAMLKILEEPPVHAQILLIGETEEALLPTIISRCQVIVLEKRKANTVSKTDEITNILVYLEKEKSLGERMAFAEEIAKDKDSALRVLEDAIIATRDKLLVHRESKEYFQKLLVLQETYKIIKTTNVSPRLAVENLFLRLDTGI